MPLSELSQILGNIGEFIGAIAVLLTLGYLAVQVRQNNRQPRDAGTDALIREINELRRAILENEDVAKLIVEGQADEQLDAVAHFRYLNSFDHVIGILWGMHSRIRNRTSNYDAAYLDSLLMGLQNTPRASEMWQQIRDDYPLDFRECVDRFLPPM